MFCIFARIIELCSISNLLCQLYIIENDIVIQNMYIVRDRNFGL